MKREIDDNAAACEQIDHDQRLVTLPVYVHYFKNHSGKDTYSVASYDMSEYNPSFVKIGKTELVYLIPEAFDPIAQEVAALKRKKMDVINEFTNRIKELDEQIGKLTAIEYKPAEF